MKRAKTQDSECWDKEDFSPGVPQLPLGSYSYKKVFVTYNYRFFKFLGYDEKTKLHAC